MLDRKVQMLDAGMVLFASEKPFGTVLGGIKAEMSKIGIVKRSNEFSREDIPDTTGDCDLFVDWSTLLRWRGISCRLEDAGPVGRDAEGKEIRRYAACFKEGNKNRKLKVVVVLAISLALLLLGIIGFGAVPNLLTVIAGCVLSTVNLILCLRPSVKAQKAIKALIDIVAEAK